MNEKIYRGIKVHVSFKGEGEIYQNEDESCLAQLSGGQKTVVVIAMIFAVLKMYAAPFYILDEFDHALDVQYRGAIATLINQLSASSQFLITTFKPDLINSVVDANICEVKFAQRKSSLVKIQKKRALEIVASNNAA